MPFFTLIALDVFVVVNRLFFFSFFFLSYFRFSFWSIPLFLFEEYGNITTKSFTLFHTFLDVCVCVCVCVCVFDFFFFWIRSLVFFLLKRNGNSDAE
ncbi:hypothetical protein AUEXF2481DRAFT_421832 [Aureobasidium subglaciale EXF-2481]|uniref:Uncharacterized protein n=1 Tax=Aureobasidium subglaciale (strain EXF-2481) TaxID=1043005 RepID=A0A074YEH6_AURSE|nr:uncharacterized protein AUEXF2481DRAFT_421832 [Aureobasidium subglaciale EXF-2481]KEQ92517.1 hypothetical protein AUEXF2481DRAFT_421832 [Aureobasidium subglaciale EXF-2481]